jgi:Papain family cysteine protease
MGRLLNSRFIFIWVLVSSIYAPTSLLNAQDEFYSAGAEWDSSAYNTLPCFDWYIGQKGGDYPDKLSLRPFCPVPISQGATGACSGYAFGYGAMSIMHNIQSRKAGNAEQKLSFSPNFIYNQIKRNLTDCLSPSSAEDAILLLKKQGICRLEDFDTQHDCMSMPDMKVMEKALPYRIKEGLSVFPNGEEDERKIAAIKACLQDSMPVIVNLQAYQSFQNISSKGIWTRPYEDEYLGKHYITIIGYDDSRGCFEIMNSWGQNWADRGFAFMKYQQLAAWSLAAYYLLLPNQSATTRIFAERAITNNQNSNLKKGSNSNAAASATPIVKQMLHLQGSLQFNHVEKMPDNTIGSTISKVQWNSKKGFYELANGNVALNEVFQLKAANLDRGKFVYIFSCDPTGDIKLHFPKNSVVSNRSAVSLIPYSKVELTIPSPRNALQLSHIGDDYLCIIYSEEALPIDTYLMKLRQIDDVNKNFPTLLAGVIEQKLISNKNILYSQNTMFASANVSIGSGVAIPIILKVTAE